jgi:hypothetical protein
LGAGAGAEADGPGSADGGVLGAGAASGPPPPWPPLPWPPLPPDGSAAGAEADGAGSAGALPLGAALGAADGGFTAVAATSPVALSTLRNRICAAWPTFLSSSASWPAMDTTMLRLPSTTTSASETPSAFTRFSMICRDCSMLCADGGCPFCSEAWYVACVPPTRSRPSFGCSRSVKLPLAPAPKKANRYRTTKIRPSTASCRPGCGCPCGGRATAVCLPVRIGRRAARRR